MTAVESSAGSSDLMLGRCARLQQPAQSLGGAGEGQQSTVSPDLRGGPAAAARRALTSTRSQSHAATSGAAIRTPAANRLKESCCQPRCPVAGSGGPMSSWAALKRPDMAENTQTATASAPAGRPALEIGRTTG